MCFPFLKQETNIFFFFLNTLKKHHLPVFSPFFSNEATALNRRHRPRRRGALFGELLREDWPWRGHTPSSLGRGLPLDAVGAVGVSFFFQFLILLILFFGISLFLFFYFYFFRLS